MPVEGADRAPDDGRVRFRFSDRSDGDFAIDGDPSALRAARQRLAPGPWTWMRQVHGAGVVVVDAPGEYAGSPCDAAVTSVPGAVLAVQTADCAPVVLWAPGPGPSAGPVVGIAHAGWRGLYEGVVEATVEAMRSLGAGPVAAVLGPCISPAAYEFGEAELTTMALRFGPDVVAATDDGRPALDVGAAVASALRTVGVHDLTVLNSCTARATDGNGAPRFFSHRARADVGRQASVVWIEP